MAPIKGKVPWTITLTQVDNGGLIVQVGCKNLVFEDPLMAVRELGRLYEQPNSVMEEYSRKFGWPTEALNVRGDSPVGVGVGRLTRGRAYAPPVPMPGGAEEAIEDRPPDRPPLTNLSERDVVREPYPGALPDPTGSPF